MSGNLNDRVLSGLAALYGTACVACLFLRFAFRRPQ